MGGGGVGQKPVAVTLSKVRIADLATIRRGCSFPKTKTDAALGARFTKSVGWCSGHAATAAQCGKTTQSTHEQEAGSRNRNIGNLGSVEGVDKRRTTIHICKCNAL